MHVKKDLVLGEGVCVCELNFSFRVFFRAVYWGAAVMAISHKEIKTIVF